MNDKSKYTFPLSALCVTLIGMIALLMPFGPFLYSTASMTSSTYSYTWKIDIIGFDMITGKYSAPPCLISWILVLLGTLLPIISLIPYTMDAKRVAGRLLMYGGGLLAIGAVMYFFFRQFASSDSSSSSNIHLGACAYIGGIVGIIGGILGLIMGQRQLQ